MKNTEEEIKKTFINLLKNHDIESIDVRMICEALNIKRQSFYYHYKNIYDVIYSLFEEDFNREILKSSAKDVLEEFSFSYLYRSMNNLLKMYDLRIDGIRDISRYLSKATSSQILYYFAHEDYLKDEIYQKITYLINKDLIDYLVKNYKQLN